MAVLSSKQILQEKNTNDPNSITALTLTHKALSDVSCLSEFKNLERLDLGFNNLTSLEWLSVVQNKLESLKGVEGLTKLNVLNAGKNKLKSMNEVRALVSLRALILNENEIVSICKLDQMKELNTLVLSRNPISEIGEALFKTKSMTKSCRELKELRLAHNDIKTLPGELTHNTKLQNLDLGNNLITKWSDLKVLSSLTFLKNLNLQGNPIAEKESLAKKIKKLLPNLHIFNARLTDKTNRKESDRAENSPLDIKSKLGVQKDLQIDPASDYKKSKKHRLVDQGANTSIDDMEDLEMKNLSSQKQNNEQAIEEAADLMETGSAKKNLTKKKLNKLQHDDNNISGNLETPVMNPDIRKDLKRKKHKTDEKFEHKALDIEGNSTISKEEFGRKSQRKVKQKENDVLVNGEIPFTELFTSEMAVNSVGEKTGDKFSRGIDVNDGIVSISTKRRKNKDRASAADVLQLSVDAEVGLGGPSTWDNY